MLYWFYPQSEIFSLEPIIPVPARLQMGIYDHWDRVWKGKSRWIIQVGGKCLIQIVIMENNFNINTNTNTNIITYSNYTTDLIAHDWDWEDVNMNSSFFG